MKKTDSLTDQIKKIILSNGFSSVGISKADKLYDGIFLKEWIDNGFHADMDYMDDVDKRSNVRAINTKFKSVISCSLNYNSLDSKQISFKARRKGRGWISKYALGDDYHKTIIKKLKIIQSGIEEIFINDINIRVYVDTGPILERAYAVKSGLGWIGKNSCLINHDHGSWFFLSNILIDQELTYDLPNLKNLCGSCTRCINACPTDAIVKDKVIDSRKCISYLTIENRKYIENDLASKIKNNIFGCDICQEVCPWNKESSITKLNEFLPRKEFLEPDVLDLLHLIEKDWDKVKIKSPLKRVKKDGLIRNILIVMGNLANSEYISILEKYLKSENIIHAMTAKDSIERIRESMVS